MYKPHTIEQYKVYRFLEENFCAGAFPARSFVTLRTDAGGQNR